MIRVTEQSRQQTVSNLAKKFASPSLYPADHSLGGEENPMKGGQSVMQPYTTMTNTKDAFADLSKPIVYQQPAHCIPPHQKYAQPSPGPKWFQGSRCCPIEICTSLHGLRANSVGNSRIAGVVIHFNCPAIPATIAEI